MHLRRPFVATLLAGAALAHDAPVRAQWAVDGTALTQATGSQESPIVLSDPAGGAVVVWLDLRHGTREIYAQRVTGAGEIAPGWDPDGMPVFTAGGGPMGIVAVADGSGGAVVAWTDTRDTPGGRVFAQHISGLGTLAPGWTPLGVQVSVSSSGRYVTTPAIASDGAGGALVMYGSYYVLCLPGGGCFVTEPVIFAERVSAAGTITPPWSNGEVLVNSTVALVPVMIPDGAGGAFGAWVQSSGSGSEVRLQRVTAAGVIAAGWPAEGVALATGPCEKSGLKLAPDGAGGALAVWSCLAAGGSSDVFAARVTAAGTAAAGWPLAGVPVCTAAGDQAAPDLVPDGGEGALITWQDSRSGDADVYALHLDGAGGHAPGWPVDGLAACAAAGAQLAPQGATDGAGGLYVAWTDLRGGGSADLFAQHVTAGGAPAAGWPPDGIGICLDPQAQSSPGAVSDGAGGAIVAWQDDRSAGACGGCFDVYALRLVTDGTVAALVTVVRGEFEGGAVRLEWSLSGEAPIRVGIERAQAGGPWTFRDSVFPSGDGRVFFADAAVTPGTRYGYRLALEDRSGVRRAGEVWVEVSTPPALALLHAWPHPAVRDLRIRFTLPDRGEARLELLDPAGRRLRSLRVGDLGAGPHAVDLESGGRVPSGLYLVRLVRGSEAVSTRIVLLR